LRVSWTANYPLEQPANNPGSSAAKADKDFEGGTQDSANTAVSAAGI